MNNLPPKVVVGIALITLATLASFGLAVAEEVPEDQVLFQNVNIFNGSDDKLYENHHVLIVGNRIAKISEDPIKATGAETIDGAGKTLMPGLIEGHGHLQMNGTSLADIENNRNMEELAVRSAAKAKIAHSCDAFSNFVIRWIPF